MRPDQRDHFLALNQTLHRSYALGFVRLGVDLHEFERTAVYATGLVDLVHNDLSTLIALVAEAGEGARGFKHRADANAILADGEPRQHHSGEKEGKFSHEVF